MPPDRSRAATWAAETLAQLAMAASGIIRTCMSVLSGQQRAELPLAAAMSAENAFTGCAHEGSTVT